VTSIERWLSEQPDDPATAALKLIDALRGFIRSSEEIGSDLLRDGQITAEQYRSAMRGLEQYRAILCDMERHQLDPSLHGLRDRRERMG
jgi:hypothetical protein